jgi:hypothetical protein
MISDFSNKEIYSFQCFYLKPHSFYPCIFSSFDCAFCSLSEASADWGFKTRDNVIAASSYKKQLHPQQFRLKTLFYLFMNNLNLSL